MTNLQLVKELSYKLHEINHDNPKRTIEELLAHQLHCSPLEIYNYPTPDIKIFNSLVDRLLKFEPLQYITGEVNFYGMELKCDQRALIPRPETEILVNECIRSSKWNNPNISVADVGTGSGCIAISLACAKSAASIDAIDISNDALALAKENAQRYNLKNINFYKKDLLKNSNTNTYDIIISNPPYISTENWKSLSVSVNNFEPRLALDAGLDGTECIELIIKDAYQVLKKDGIIFLEIGHDQKEKTENSLNQYGFKEINFKKDYNQLDRIVSAKK